MQFSFSGEKPETAAGDALVFFFGEKEQLSGSAKLVDKLLGGHLTSAIKAQEFSGKEGQTILIPTHGRMPAKHVALIGIGKPTLEGLRRGSAAAVRRAKTHGVKTLNVILPAFVLKRSAEAGQAAAEGASLGDYAFEKYKSLREAAKKKVEAVTLLGPTRLRRLVAKGISRGQLFAQATVLVRDLVNEPASSLTPRHLVAEAERLAQAPGIGVKVFEEKQLKAMGAGAILGVGRGSDERSFLVHLSYTPAKARKTVAIVGKGVTFDSGGINLKPEKGLENMKMDMTGAADILGVFSALPALKPRVAVHGILCLVENMPSGKALKPGDIVRAMDGTTIEVRNTDAEGRLILADGLTYARKLKPQAVIDVATLTGACVVALGEDVAGLFSTSRKLAVDLRTAAEAAGESLWELPLVDSYAKLIESEIADLKNVGKPGSAGAITAALFLKHFAKDTPWAHLDVAGPAWAETDNVPYLPKGATGFGVRTLLTYLAR